MKSKEAVPYSYIGETLLHDGRDCLIGSCSKQPRLEDIKDPAFIAHPASQLCLRPSVFPCDLMAEHERIRALHDSIYKNIGIPGCGNESNGSADNTQGTTQQSGTDSAGDETDPEDTVQGTAEEDSAQTGEETQGTGSNILVAYFSWADNAVLAGDVDTVTSPSVISPEGIRASPAKFRELYSANRTLG